MSRRISFREFVLYAAMGVLVVLAMGCSIFPSAHEKLLGHQNAYAFRVTEFADACVVADPPAPCFGEKKFLDAWETHLHRTEWLDWPPAPPATVAKVERHGAIPLQLAQLRADARAAAKLAKAVKKASVKK